MNKFKNIMKKLFDHKRQVFGVLILIIGLSIIGSTFYMKYSADAEQKRMIAELERLFRELGDIETLNPGNEDPLTPGTDSPDIAPQGQNVKAMAIMIIPKINLRVAVADGTDTETLKYAVGRFQGTGMPGEKGNFAVGGHRSYTYNQYFNRLDELEDGDEIIVQTPKGEFTYIVNKKFVVDPSEVHVLDTTEDATITLVTCTPIRVATHRLIIKGYLQE
jgi:sortase A